jgi:hypothetical protein
MVDFARLSRNWIEWTRLARMTHVSISEGCTDCEIFFKSDDQSFHLRQDGDWWTVDEVDDRGKRYNATAKFSTFDLAEKYLIWNWAAVTRSAIGAKQLGVHLHALGMAPNVEIVPTEREYFVELRASTGSAILPMSSATIFSHLMSKSVDEIEQMVEEGVV